MEKDLSIDKEVLDWLVNGVYASVHCLAIETRDASLNSIKSKIFALRNDIVYAKTEEDLATIEEKLKAYQRAVDNSQSSVAGSNAEKDSKE